MTSEPQRWADGTTAGGGASLPISSAGGRTSVGLARVFMGLLALIFEPQPAPGLHDAASSAQRRVEAAIIRSLGPPSQLYELYNMDETTNVRTERLAIIGGPRFFVRRTLSPCKAPCPLSIPPPLPDCPFTRRSSARSCR